VGVSAGGRHSCGLRSDGSVVCWGSDEDGQAASPNATTAGLPVAVFHAPCGPFDGRDDCWWDFEDRLGDALLAAAPLPRHGSHQCVVGSDGGVVCWGANEVGQADAPGGRFASVSAGWGISCGVRIEEIVVCWGGGEGLVEDPDGVLWD